MLKGITKEVYEVLKKDRYYAEDLYIGVVDLGTYRIEGMTRDEVKQELEPFMKELMNKPLRPAAGGGTCPRMHA
jgi:hypothetical protein